MIVLTITVRRKLHDDLQDQGETCCPNRVAHLAKLAGIKALIDYKRRNVGYGGKPSIAIDNTLYRQFEVGTPDKVWVTDITYIKTSEGFAYLAVVIDLYSRKVVGLLSVIAEQSPVGQRGHAEPTNDRYGSTGAAHGGLAQEADGNQLSVSGPNSSPCQWISENWVSHGINQEALLNHS